MAVDQSWNKMSNEENSQMFFWGERSKHIQCLTGNEKGLLKVIMIWPTLKINSVNIIEVLKCKKIRLEKCTKYPLSCNDTSGTKIPIIAEHWKAIALNFHLKWGKKGTMVFHP